MRPTDSRRRPAARVLGRLALGGAAALLTVGGLGCQADDATASRVLVLEADRDVDATIGAFGPGDGSIVLGAGDALGGRLHTVQMAFSNGGEQYATVNDTSSAFGPR